MKTRVERLAAWLAVLLPWHPTPAAPVLHVVAAENFYGDIARQIGGQDVEVTSILANPDQDPHLFEASPSAARALSAAAIVIENGIGYDSWADRLVAAADDPAKRVIDVSSLAGRHGGDNPHVWYDPATMGVLARVLAASYAAADPAHAAGYAQRLIRFDAAMMPVSAKIAGMRRTLRGVKVTATEPLIGYLLDALGIVSLDQGFQRAVMNDTEASASDVAAFQDDLRAHRVRLLIVNRQASNAVANRMKAIAVAAGVPVVGATETEPLGLDYQAWMLGELDELEKALAAPAR